MFRYMADNTISDIQTIDVHQPAYNIAVTPYSEWLVATGSEILLYEYNQQSTELSIKKRYQLDPADHDVTDIQASISHITVRTASNTVYTYDRKYTSLNYLINKEQITETT